MRMFKITPLAAATALALGLGVAGSANANVYGVSFTEVKNGLVLACVDKTSIGGSACTIDPTILNFTSISSSSSTNATLNGATATGSFVTGNNPDAIAAELGNPLKGNEYVRAVDGLNDITNTSYILIGDNEGTFGTDYSRGDARVVTEQSLTSFINAWAVAEVNITENGQGNATGERNTSQSDLQVAINAGADCATFNCYLSISFDANPYLRAFVGATSVFDAFVTVDLNVKATLQNSAGASFMNFTALDEQRSRSWSQTGEQIYSLTDGFLNYATTSSFLVPSLEKYQLTLTMTNQVNAKNAVVPEPGTLALLGLGLSGLGFRAWRKRGGRKV